ncbi:MAG: ATP-binding protein [Gammaproteobacteria bacterium]|nr:ATP-binding protein [Gammaproteobacteria bacterium]
MILVWLTNPFTLGPYLFLAYKTGAFILNVPPQPFDFEFTIIWAEETLHEIWQPILLGCLTYSTATAAGGYFLVRWLWRTAAIRKWEARKQANKRRVG